MTQISYLPLTQMILGLSESQKSTNIVTYVSFRLLYLVLVIVYKDRVLRGVR